MSQNCPDVQPLGKNFFLGRQPIVNRAQELFAYELLFRATKSNGAYITDDFSATAAVIAHAAELGMEQVLGNFLGFINIDAQVLLSDFIKFLPRDKVVLEILETVKATPDVLARIGEMNAAGFTFALDDVISDSEDVRKLIPLVEVVKVDITGIAPVALSALAQKLRSPQRKLLAEKVETVAEFDRCMALGFDYFQGYYFAKPVILSGKKLTSSELSIMRLLSLIDSDADNREIERQIKHDPLISINLLRMVNTPAAGSKRRIDSVAQALLSLGRRQLQRWLQILLYAKPGKGGAFSSPLLQLASTRGKLLELIAEKRFPGQRIIADIAFTVGVMSNMDALFSIPMDHLLAKLNVADDVSAALLHRTGNYGDMLRLVELIESVEDAGPALLPAMQALGLNTDELYEIQLVAFEWVNKITPV